jgi:putative membrane-bound dehydrogenase-like protein
MKTRQIQLNGHTFTLPVGFDIELAAGPPLVDRPIVADFDEQGRLYVADSSGSNEPVAQQLLKKPHRILRLADSRGTGHFDQRTIFADQMMFPEGVMWFAGSLYVAAPPSIWKLTDTDGDGVADERLEWFQGKTLTGCANDLHGPYLGPDGWIYWCKGAFAKQTYERPPSPLPSPPAGGEGKGKGGRPPFVTRAAHIFRCRPDGSGIEPVMTGGMDNPVDVVFTPGGERIFTTTFFQHPGGGLRDGLVHAIYGGIYGKDHDVVYEHKWTNPALMPVLTHMGAAAPCGLVRYESSVFGPEYQDNLFACQFNMHKVSRHVLEPHGATFKCRDEDFLVSDNLDFHPTDVVEDADGSLLIIDTGGWYKLCCPTSWLHKPDVLGAIYRIRRQGAPQVDDPRGLKLAWSKLSAAKLARLLDDPRPAVRRRTIESLGQKGADALPALNDVLGKAGSPEAFRNAIWALTRIDHANARLMVRRAMALDEREIVRQVAIHSASIWRDSDAVPTLIELLKNPSLHNRRAAAEALGRIGDKTAVPALLTAVAEPADRALEHSLVYALIEIADSEGTAKGLQSGNMRVRRAALTALDQMDGGRLEAKAVAAELASTDPAMKEVAWWIAGRHPEWGGDLAGVFHDRLSAKNMSAAERDDLVRQLARFARATAVQDFLAERLRDSQAPSAARCTVLRAMAQSGLRMTPKSWVDAMTEVLAGNDSDLIREAVSTARALRLRQPVENLIKGLLRIGTQVENPPALRLSALAAIPGGLTQVPPLLFLFLRAQLGSEQPVATRGLAADALSHAKLSREQLLELAESVKTAGPMEMDRLLDAFTPSADEDVGRKLVSALKESSARSSLRTESLKQRLAKYSASVQKDAAELYALLDQGGVQQKVKLDQLLASLKEGDARRGQTIFYGTKAACSSCHAIGYLGGNIGPDLTRIGKIRSDRDLLESIVFPSASFVRSYEPWLVTTKSGKVHNGVLRKDAPDEIVLATGANQEVRIARDDVEEMQPGKVSIMPAGLDQQLTPRELADLVAFLRACK